MSGCPDPSVLEAFGQGTLDAATRDALDVHLDRCTACASVVAQLARLYGSVTVNATASSRAIDPDSARPTALVVGRYQLGRLLGAGGMGMVYEAVDPELHRRVAIKLLHLGVAADVELTRSRMLREARAMAQLAHPNVVAVHDVGRLGEQVFVAMELVEGTTLTRWLQASVRSRREILAMFVQAGRGLEAAHAVGLVHRDFKPDNVLIGVDGRARVTDFGLARPALTWPEGTTDAAVVAATAAGLGVTQQVGAPASHSTAHGAVVGTPAYMAPEQWRGAQADARTDQFSFCVALFEACFAMRPFAGDDFYALAEQVLSGKLVLPPRTAPAWLRAAIVRGLQADPSARHPSMSTLLAALERDRTRAIRIAGVALAMGLSVAATVGVLAWTATATSDAPPPLALPTPVEAPSPEPAPVTAPAPAVVDPQQTACIAKLADAEGRWNAKRRNTLFAHLRTMDDGEAIATRSLPVLDRWATRWTSLAAASCAVDPAFVHADAQRRCLADALPRFDALVQQVLDLPTFSVDDSVASAAHRLPDLRVCESPAWLAVAPTPAAAAQRGEASLLTGELAMAEALTHLGQLTPAPDVLARVVLRAKTLGHAPLLAEAQLALGIAHAEKYDSDAATAALEAAAITAQGGVHDHVFARAALLLVEQYGAVQLRPTDANRWQRLVATLDSRLGDPWLGGALLLASGLALHGQAEYSNAAATNDAARPKLVEAFGQDHPEVGRLLLASAATHAALGDQDEAEDMTDRAIELLEQAVGPTDLRYAAALGQRARNEIAKGLFADARVSAEHAAKLATGSQSLRHDFDQGTYLGLVGDAIAGQGETAEALAMYQKSKIYLYVDAPKILPLLWQGRLLIETGSTTDGLMRLDEARAEIDIHLAEGDARRIEPLCAIGRLQRQAKRLDMARRNLESALAIAQDKLGFSPRTSLVKWDLAALEVDEGKLARALELYDDAHVPMASALDARDPRMVDSLLARADLAWSLDQKDYAGRLYDGVVEELTKRFGPKDGRAARARERRIVQGD